MPTDSLLLFRRGVVCACLFVYLFVCLRLNNNTRTRSFQFLINMLFLYRYSGSLEQTVFEDRRADYVFFLLFCAVVLLVSVAFAFELNGLNGEFLYI